MIRSNIINIIGLDMLTTNIENEEFSYQKALKNIGIDIKTLYNETEYEHHFNIDLRFANDKLSILVETKSNFDLCNKDKIYKQLQDYVKYEQQLTNNKIVAIIANTLNNKTLMWYGSNPIIDDFTVTKNKPFLSFKEYEDTLLSNYVNNKYKVTKSTYELNEILHECGIPEYLRSQFVGTCLLSLKHNLNYQHQSTSAIIGGIKDILFNIIYAEDKTLEKEYKLNIINDKILNDKNIQTLSKEDFYKILFKIKNDILPFINDKNTAGQDLLNLFFTTFNKYVGKSDKNQTFTPDHIVHFMCKVVGINRYSRILDPCCGSGAFLVRALTEALDDCDTKEEKEIVKKDHIYGIEFDEKCFGLSTTNMLIHGDGNSNIIQGSCFDKENFIKNANIDIVLMNPSYNATKKFCNKEYIKEWENKTKEDPSHGLHYVYWVASKVKKGKLAVLLPMSCAIGTSKHIKYFKELMLEEHTLDAVFSLPLDMFYPGASVAAVCMVFNLGIRHKNAIFKKTFFGYFRNDGFIKKKYLGRVEKTDSNGNGLWKDIENEWLNLYKNRITKIGLSVTKEITADDEWLAEAYIKTDYTKLNQQDFQNTVNKYLGYLINNGELTNESI